MRVLIDEYIESKKFAWAASTLRSERYRLYALESLLNGNSVQLWEYLLENQKPYARLTSWTRVVEFWQYLIDEGKIPYGKNPYKEWRKKNARVFKNTYTKTKPEISFEEARRRISLISDANVQALAVQLLENGLRYNEAGTLSNGSVVGKGGKPRNVYISEGPHHVPYHRFYSGLKQVGLKPHTLRKLFGSRLVELGANEFELCEIMGWSNLNTASSYIKVNKNRIKDLVEKVRG